MLRISHRRPLRQRRRRPLSTRSCVRPPSTEARHPPCRNTSVVVVLLLLPSTGLAWTGDPSILGIDFFCWLILGAASYSTLLLFIISEHIEAQVVQWNFGLVKANSIFPPTLTMDYLEIKNEEENQMDPIQIKDNEEQLVEMLVDEPCFLEPLCPEEVNEDTRVYPRVGEEYQVEVPNLATEEEHMKLRSLPVDDSRMFGFDYSVGVGLAIPVTWTQQTGFSGHSSCPSQDEHNSHSGHIPRNFSQNSICPECLGCKVEYDEQDQKFSKSAGQDMHCLQKRKVLGCSCVKRKVNDYIPLPGMPRYSWTEEEAQTFLLGLYIFGKNLVQVMKFMEIKTMGEVLSYYYGEFFRSDVYRRWAACRKVRSRRCILGLRIFSGPRQQELLSRLLAGVAREVQDSLLEVFKTFNEGTSTFEQFILSLRTTVGAQVLVEAVGIGKGKYDLTGFALDPSRNHGISTRPEIPIGKACSLLSSGDIIKFLTGDFRLSKAKSNDLFWEAVWPRLLARGWHSEQPKDSSPVGKHALVFLIPGVKKFSRNKLVKGNHYFDSVSDVLSKVASEPRLLEFGVEGGNNVDGIKLENGWIHDFEPDKSTLPDKKPPSYIRPSEPGCSPELMKFTVVDTSLVQGEEPCKVRSLRNLPTDAGHGYMSSPRSGDSGSDSSEHSDSEDSSHPNEHINTNQNTTDAKYFNEKKCKPLTGDKMDSDVLQKISAFSGAAMPINGHVSIEQGFETMNNVCSSTATIIPVGNQRVHTSNSLTEVNFQFNERVNPEPQVFLAPVSKRRRLVSCKNERTGRKNTAVNKRHDWKQVDTPLQHDMSGANEASAGAKPFLWGAIPSSSTNITLDMNNTQAYCRQLHTVPPNVETMVYKENAQDMHVIDLNVPQMPSDYESTASYIVPLPPYENTPTVERSIHSSETKEMDGCLPDINASSNALLSKQLCFNSRRQSTRSRPPTARALEALACGFMGKQKGGEANFPSSSRSSRPVRRPRRSTDVVVPFPSDGEGSSSHFTDSAIIVNEWCMSNPQYQILHSTSSDKSTDKGSHELFGQDKSADKGSHELFGIP